ncbi:MAG: D-alanine--D-alanine ligase [bacterium]|nr:D-alanine--D-alanine ligase [bacterium]
MRVGLLFGGRSVEHEVSVVSARSVAAAMHSTQLECVPLAVTGDGRWLAPQPSAAILDADLERTDATDTDDGRRVWIDPGGGGLLLGGDGAAARPLELDVVFPLIHGWGGEDGRLQGALDLAEVPCVGAGVVGSSVGMDKAISKELFRNAGLDVVPSVSLTAPEYAAASREVGVRLVERLGLPLFVKPAAGGSSVGVARVASSDELGSALEQAFELDRKVVVEVAVDAREIECAVLGNDAPEASGLGEIRPSTEFYDYRAKYVDDSAQLDVPARVEPELAERIRSEALRAYRALDLCGFARVDFLLDRESGRSYLNEINTLPGFTPVSMFPKLWEAAGLAYPRLIERLVALALERSRSERARTTRRPAV